jgi:hypothetical protein
MIYDYFREERRLIDHILILKTSYSLVIGAITQKQILLVLMNLN